jgi:hypothetical protein
LLDVPHKLVFSPTIELPFGEGKRWAQSGFGAAVLGDWVISSIIAFESGFPISISQNSNGLSNAFFLVQRPNPTGTDPATSGERDQRLYFTGATPADPGVWLNPAAYSDPGLYVLGTNPRTQGNVRTPHRNNWDFVAIKDVRLGGSRRAQVKVEVLNITNTVKTVGPNTQLGNANFGRVLSQRGFMRLTQLTFRLSF